MAMENSPSVGQSCYADRTALHPSVSSEVLQQGHRTSCVLGDLVTAFHRGDVLRGPRENLDGFRGRLSHWWPALGQFHHPPLLLYEPEEICRYYHVMRGLDKRD